MKRIIHILLSGWWTAAFFLAACSTDTPTADTMPDDGVGFGSEIRFSIDFADGGETRATTDPWFKTTFDTGDTIGIFVYRRHAGEERSIETNTLYAHNVKAVFDGRAWALQTPLYYTNDGTLLDIYAYYPYTEGADAAALTYNAAEHMVDLLAASALGIEKTDGQPVPLLFGHLLSMVELIVTKGDILSGMDSTFRAYFHGAVGGTYHLATGALIAPSNGVAPMLLASMADADARAYRAWIPAQRLEALAAVFSFSQTTPGQEFSLTGEMTGAVELSQGRVYRHMTHLQDYIPKDYLYQLYDPFPKYGTPVGMVVEVYNGGRNGMVISLTNDWAPWAMQYGITGSTSQNSGISNMMTIQALSGWETMYPAFSACTSLGEGWFLPDVDMGVYLLRTEAGRINNNLSNIAGSEPIDRQATYWTSTEIDQESARKVYTGNGDTPPTDKTWPFNIRAIYQF